MRGDPVRNTHSPRPPRWDNPPQFGIFFSRRARGRVEFQGEKENRIMASNTHAARVPENRPVEVTANARPLPKPETKPTKFVIKISGAIPQ